MLDGQGCLLPVRRRFPPEDPHFWPAQQIVRFAEDSAGTEPASKACCLPAAAAGDGSAAASGLCSAAPMAERDSVGGGQDVCRDSSGLAGAVDGACCRAKEGDLPCICSQVGCKAASSGSSSKGAKKKAVQARIGDASTRKVLHGSESVDVNQIAWNGAADEREGPGRRDNRGKKTVCFFKRKDTETSDCKEKYAGVECSSAAQNGSHCLDKLELSLGLPVATRDRSAQNGVDDGCLESEINQQNGHAMQRSRKRLATEVESLECRKVTGTCAEICQDLLAENAVILSAEGELERASNADFEADGANEQQPYLPGLDDELALRCLAFVPLFGLGRLSSLCRKHRDLVKSREIFQVRRMYGRVEHLVFVYTSGPAGWTTYDANRNVWKSLPPANANANFTSSDKESLSAGTHVLWFGKDAFDFVNYRYDLLSNSWDKGPSMVNPRCLFASASCGDVAYVAGGFGPADGTGGLSVLNSAEIYNSLTGEWEQLPPMPTPRQRCAGVFMDGKFFVIGGRDENHQPFTSAEEYDPSTQLWRTIPNMYFTPTSPRNIYDPPPPLVAVVNNQLYAVENSTNALKIYNKHDNTWSDLGYLPVPAFLRNGWGVAFKALGDRLFVMGDLDGIAACCWQPGPTVTAPVWDLLSHRERGSESFLYNCAVMNC